MPLPPFELLDLREHDDPRLIEEFIKLYDTTFVDPSERENPAQWFERLRNEYPPPQPKTHLLVAVEREKPTKPTFHVLGGLVFEFYRRSQCGLLTYLVIDPTFRRQGLARALVTAATTILLSDALTQARPLKAILAETEDPRLVADSIVMNTRDRLTALAKLGAYVVDTPYVQPALEGGSGPCTHLLLVAFMPDGKSRRAIAGAVLRDFFLEFYQALGVADPTADANFATIARNLHAEIGLKEIQAFGL